MATSSQSAKLATKRSDPNTDSGPQPIDPSKPIHLLFHPLQFPSPSAFLPPKRNFYSLEARTKRLTAEPHSYGK
ncbi:hypothetical protein G7046_g9092 [Stylonectria norvegica]|nr:hypothetical protein G7046_g9092 [Stylonectria norvegica]